MRQRMICTIDAHFCRPAATSLNGIAAAILKSFRTHSSATVKFGGRASVSALASRPLSSHVSHSAHKERGPSGKSSCADVQGVSFRNRFETSSCDEI